MRTLRFLPAIILLLAASSIGQSTPSQPTFNPDAVDKADDPCVDFYQYACGSWLKTAEIPADQTSWAKHRGALVDARVRVHLHGPDPLFSFYSSPGMHSANDVIAYIDQGGLSLPDRDYYLKDDPKLAEARTSLVEYAPQMFTLAGQ